jgi:3-hydroxyacyl-CoA dehydrogenase/enoyl-CoA hydratase/3-hydroxybutyryl-CoA epimerase
MALACTYRVASDTPDTFLGLPETGIGIIPGFGGTQRLPGVVGLTRAIRMITTGTRVYPRQALEYGLVDDVAAREHLLAAARAALGGKLAKGSKQRRSLKAAVEGLLEKTRFGRDLIFKRARQEVERRTHGHYPAPPAALDAMEEGLVHGSEAGYLLEAELLGETAASDISRNLIRVFRLKESFSKGDNTPAADITNIAVVGAGAMGEGIAALAAERGFKVRLIDMSEDALGHAVKFLHEDVKNKRRKGRYTGVQEQWIPTRLTVDTVIRGVSGAQAVIEAVAERMDVKRSVFTELASALPDTSLMLTNTSSLSVTEMADGMEAPDRFAGMHFFNPVGRMPLVEVIKGSTTSEAAALKTAAFARRLGKIPVMVADSPGFLVNRLLLPYLNEAAVMLTEGAEIGVVDEILLAFGMPMGVYLLLDQVGIDIASHASVSMFERFGERMTPSPVIKAMLDDGRLGKKSGSGFYRWKGEKHEPNPEISGFLAGFSKEERELEDEEIIHRLIYPMINEASLCLEESVVESPEDVDAAMIFGAGFPPFTGGLLRYADEVGLKEVAKELRKLAKDVNKRFAPSKKLAQMAREGESFYQV